MSQENERLSGFMDLLFFEHPLDEFIRKAVDPEIRVIDYVPNRLIVLKANLTRFIDIYGHGEITPLLYQRNREYDPERIERLMTTQKDHHQRHHYYASMPPLHLSLMGLMDGEVSLVVLDGQHRLKAAHLLRDPPMIAHLHIHYHVNEEDRFITFKYLNDQTPLPERYKCSETITRPICEQVAIQVASHFSKCMSKSFNCRVPHLHLETLKNRLFGDESIRTWISDSYEQNQSVWDITKSLLGKIICYNQHLKNKDPSDYPAYDREFSVQKRQKLQTECLNKGECFIGIWKHYEWISRMMTFKPLKITLRGLALNQVPANHQ